MSLLPTVAVASYLPVGRQPVSYVRTYFLFSTGSSHVTGRYCSGRGTLQFSGLLLVPVYLLVLRSSTVEVFVVLCEMITSTTVASAENIVIGGRRLESHVEDGDIAVLPVVLALATSFLTLSSVFFSEQPSSHALVTVPTYNVI